MALADRFNYDQEKNILFIDFSELKITESHQIKKINQLVKEILDPLEHEVYSVVNYDNCKIDQEVRDEFVEMMKANQQKYSLGTVRYSNVTSTRVSLTSAGVQKKMDPHVCKSREEAIEEVEKLKQETEEE